MCARVIIKNGKKYKMVPPEGGWGYIIGLSVSITYVISVAPLLVFGIIFTDFLATLGDPTGATTLLNGVMYTVFCFTGLPANHLLQKYSYRTVGLLGAALYSIGACGNIFVTSFMEMMISFGILQGMGYGLMLPAVFCAFNVYFDKRQNIVMAVCQALIVGASVVAPAITKYLMTTFGFRGTLVLFAAFSLNGFVAMGALQPVKWHLKTEEIDDEDVKLGTNKEENEKEYISELNPLMIENEYKKNDTSIVHTKRVSIPSLSGFACSIEIIQQESKSEKSSNNLWKNLVEALDLGLFKDPIYINISSGLAFGMISDMVFLTIYPLLLADLGFDGGQSTTVMTIFFIGDLISRILFCFVSAALKIRNRYVFLLGSLFSAILRIAFTINSSFIWIVSVSACLGFFRCFIETPMPLVVAEEYGPRFATAFSLYMVVCGVISLVVGVLSAGLKQLTGSNTAVVHLLTVVYLLCAIPWILELIIVKFTKRKLTQ